jgi:hypothetical protein
MAARFGYSNPSCCERVVSVLRQDDPPCCVLANRAKVQLPHFFAAHVTAGDEIAFPIPEDQAKGAEIYVSKRATSTTGSYLYLAPIGYVTQPKTDKHNRLFVSAKVQRGGLGISAVYLPCHLLRDYFYRLPQTDGQAKCPTLYELLGVSSRAAPAEIRVAFKLRDLELESAGAPHSAHVALERAFNIVGHPELRACYDALLADPEAPAVFPYGGFGSLLVSGERSHDGRTFFARRILAFSPERRQHTFHLSLRHCDFYDDQALGRDVRRKLELWFDPAVLHTLWDSSWNQWKHMLGAKMEVEGTFVQSGKYRKHRDEWELVHWETALPSRLAIKLPADFQQQVEAARAMYHRFGQHSKALEQIRLCLEHRAIERAELERMCSGMRIPSDFDIAQISWRPDYDPFFYRQLVRRARRVYLFRDEYIFDVEKAVVIETPQLGHATYLFAKPRNMESFLALYTRIGKNDIRRNCDNTAERLGFLGRIIHGTNPRVWLKEIQERIGEKVGPAVLMPD